MSDEKVESKVILGSRSTPTTAAVCGTGGSVSIGVEVFSYRVDLELDTHNVSSMNTATTHRSFIGCVKRWSGTFSAYGGAGGVGAQTGVSFGPGDLSGNIVITNVQVQTPVSSPVTFVYTFKGDGAVS